MGWPDVEMRELISRDRLQARISELGAQITEDYRGRELVLICVLKGSFLFTADLSRRIELPIEIDFLGVSSYGDSTSSSGVVQITSDLTHPIGGKEVLLVEDIVDTGLTMTYLLENLQTRRPNSVRICTLLYKNIEKNHHLTIDYCGFEIPPEFVVGYGLDYMQKYRNLDYIGVLTNPTP
ncbi:MAG: hypoxanthine phosphoribosyltransferase [Myxococcales bacterium]|nr:hypoxanthine phosphoribosyltransferase [Myxococcales bacterium]